MNELDDETRQRLTRDLERDKSKPISDEVDRAMRLERTILDQYGRAGAVFLLQREGLQAHYDDTCPWRIEGLDAEVAVDHVLGGLRRLLPEFISMLKERVRWVIPARDDNGWVLAYVTLRDLYDGSPYYEFILGGAPNAAPTLPERPASVGWKLPRPLQTLYAVHDGLGASDGAILPSRGLVDLGEMMDPIVAKLDHQPDGYVFQDLLEFCRDGAGNCQAFHRRSRDDDDPETVDWDHETWEISEEESFFAFVDERLQSQVLDEE